MNKWKKCCAVRLIIQSAGAGAAIVIHCEVWGLSRKISSRRSGEGAKKSVLCKHGMSGGVSCVCCWYQRSPPSQQLVAKTDEIMISTNWIWNGHQPTQASCLPWLWPQIVWYRWPTAAEILSTRSLNSKNPYKESSSLSPVWLLPAKSVNIVEECWKYENDYCKFCLKRLRDQWWF